MVRGTKFLAWGLMSWEKVNYTLSKSSLYNKLSIYVYIASATVLCIVRSATFNYYAQYESATFWESTVMKNINQITLSKYCYA